MLNRGASPSRGACLFDWKSCPVAIYTFIDRTYNFIILKSFEKNILRGLWFFSPFFLEAALSTCEFCKSEQRDWLGVVSIARGVFDSHKFVLSLLDEVRSVQFVHWVNVTGVKRCSMPVVQFEGCLNIILIGLILKLIYEFSKLCYSFVSSVASCLNQLWTFHSHFVGFPFGLFHGSLRPEAKKVAFLGPLRIINCLSLMSYTM